MLSTLVLVSAGCGGSYELHSLSGSVMFEGEPVPTGRLTFIPDEEAGNRGPRVEATVQDGRYETDEVVGGKYVVEVDGFAPDPADEDEMIRLFPIQQLNVDLPQSGGTYDFEISDD